MKRVLIFSSLVVVGCSNQNNTKKIIWEGSGEPPRISVQASHTDVSLNNKKDKIKIDKQYVEELPIEESYVKQISDKNGKVRFISAQYVDSISNKLKVSAQEIKKTSEAEWLTRLYAQKPALKDKKMLEPPQYSIIRYQERLIPVVKFNLMMSGDEMQSWVFDQKMNFLYTANLGSHFSTAKALAYPEGPKLTALSTVFLKSLIGDQLLKTDQINVTSESPSKINIEESMSYTPPDERFDQVQVFYYIQQALNWFEENLNIEAGRLHINAVAHLGYPDKINAAFYYNGVVRLGSGDDESFSHIPLDPSIVMHESSHALIDMLSSLPFQNEGGSLNEGFADFFTCIQLNNPKLGEVAYKKAPFKRQVDLLVPLKEKSGGLYHDSAIVSSFFWKLKEKIGSTKAVQLALEVLKKMTPASDLNAFKDELFKTINSDLTDDDLKEALTLFKIWSE